MGSCLAPVLSEIYLSFVERAIETELKYTDESIKAFGYVDNYLVLHYRAVNLEAILPSFLSAGGKLKIKRGDPSAEGLQFLDLRLTKTNHDVCWAFKQRSKKKNSSFF